MLSLKAKKQSSDQEYILVGSRNSPVSQLFFPSDEQPDQCISAHKSKQPTAGCIAIFNKYCCYIKHRGISSYGILGGMSLICQNASARCVEHGLEYTMYYILC